MSLINNNNMVKEKLRLLRKTKNITQQEVANAIHTTSSNYCRKENGEVKILLDEWQKIANFLNVSVADIYEDESKTTINQNHASGENSGLNCSYYNIPSSIIENLKDYIDILKSTNKKLEEENNKLKNSKL